MARQFFVGGNWKMNGSHSEVEKILTGLKGEVADHLDANTG
jgi:triosephosphate isomerase